MRFLKSHVGIILILALSYFAIKPLFISGFFPMHDDTQPARVYEMAKALRDGMFPVRWVADLGYGYGYPIFNFYGPFAYYVGGTFHLLGMDALTATKIMMALGMVFAGITMYYLSRNFWGEFGGIISGLLYLYAPYHALDLYVRGDVSEVYAYAFIPLMFLSFYEVFTTLLESVNLNTQSVKSQLKAWKWIGIGALSYAAVILSHNLSALMMTPFLGLVIMLFSLASYFKYKNFHITYYLLFATFLGILIAAFYWLPALGEMQFTNIRSQIGGKADYRLHFVCPTQLWESNWGFGGSAPGCHDGMSYRVGKLHIILSVISIVLLPLYWRKSKKHAFTILIVSIVTGASIWLTTESSKFLWDTLSIMKFFQYPWRFLLMVSFFSSFLGGFILWAVSQFIKRYAYYEYTNIFVFTLLSVGIVFLYGKLFIPQTVLPKTAVDYTSEQALKWNISKISDEYLPKHFKKPESINDIVYNKFSVISGRAVVDTLDAKTQEVNIIVSAQSPSTILIKTAYFPAWSLYVNDVKNNYKIIDGGLLAGVYPGKTNLRLRFEQTQIEKLGNILSLIGIVMLVIGIIRTQQKQRFN